MTSTNEQDLATHSFILNKIPLTIVDYAGSETPTLVYKDLLKNCYNIEKIHFLPGDIILDIGANVGLVCIYIAKRFPFTKVYAFEPIPENYKHLRTNLKLNGVKNVVIRNEAITSDGRDFDMIVDLNDNSGGGTGHLKDMKLEGHSFYRIKSITLDDVFKRYDITHCKLLKIDCEGTEHEILQSTKVLSKVEYLSGEFHINENLASYGFSINSLTTHCRKFIPRDKLKISAIRMAE